jgi:hypothetical protein
LNLWIPFWRRNAVVLTVVDLMLFYAKLHATHAMHLNVAHLQGGLRPLSHLLHKLTTIDSATTAANTEFQHAFHQRDAADSIEPPPPPAAATAARDGVAASSNNGASASTKGDHTASTTPSAGCFYSSFSHTATAAAAVMVRAAALFTQRTRI